MKNLDLATYGVEEMNEVQMQEVDGGFFWLIPVAVIACVAFSSCNNNVTVNVGAGTGNNVNVQVGDSISNQQ